MNIKEQLMVDDDTLSRGRFNELMESNEKNSLTGSEVAELTVYLVQLGLYFWIEKRQQTGKTDDEIFDGAISKHQANKQALKEDMGLIAPPEIADDSAMIPGEPEGEKRW